MSAPDPHLPDPYLAVPLDGVQLVEASAGTGKTYTLATLVTRLVVERRLRIGQILAVTFTEAATQELRKRIRERLQLTLDLLDAPPRADEAAEAALTRALLHAHRQRGDESDAVLRRRLRQAVVDIDLAAIFTIHGFCARVLREHALDTGHGFDAPELLANERELREEVAADLWRAHAQDAADADDLLALWPQGYRALAKDLRVLLGREPLLPADAPLPSDPLPRVQAAGQALADAFRAHGAAFLDALRAALIGKVLNGQSYKIDWIEPLWRDWATWCEAGDFTAAPDERIARFAADVLHAKTNKGKEALVPASPLCALIPPYLDAVQARADYLALRRAALLHRLRGGAQARMATLKRQRRVQTYDDLIEQVADALAGPHGELLAQRLRAQYAVALVDEFQDTDARQWAIFARVFGHDGGAPSLFLIGDPKQAIYGFRGGDVHTYLDAGERAERTPPLARNFRSRPLLLAALDALYAQAGEHAFVDARIRFHPLDAGDARSDTDYLRDAAVAPALTVWRAPDSGEFDAKGKPKVWSAPRSRELAAQACVAAIHDVLTAARHGKATLSGEPVQPGDIAVLVRWHKEATLVQQALALAGIPAVAAGKQSLFATAEARDLHVLLLALLHGGDEGRLRAALGTVLVGVDAAGIDALEHDGERQRRWQLQAQHWRDHLRGGGPLALVGELCADNAERLLALLDGERRISNYLQLAELLQEAQAQALGLQGLVDWLGRRIADADPDDEAQQLRLESDARRVQIVTLHKSKGLEYPLVFLPFAGIGAGERAPGNLCAVHDGASGRRRLHWKFETLPGAAWKDACDAWKAEQRAEDARLLYVGLTRARHALWLATGPFHQHAGTPLAKMLGDPAALAAAGVVIDATPPPEQLPRLSLAAEAAIAPARTATRALHADWWVYSFSQLAKAEAGDASSAATLPAPGGNDEPDLAEAAGEAEAFDPRFAGNRYGVALHAALEHADFAAWRGWQAGDAAPGEEAGVIAAALGGEGYPEDAMADGIALTTRLIGHTLTVALPEGVRLCGVPADERRPELEFQFALQSTRVDALLDLLHAHGVVRDRHGFGLRQRLEGLMTGLIDLTYRVDGKWYVLDYKSNRLPGYDAASLQRAMAHSEYDLQALIYTLALHRWLRFRLGDGYDYARDFGGIRYLFCRGLDAGSAASPGIHAQRFAPELVHELDALFGGEKPFSQQERGKGSAKSAEFQT